MSEMRINEIFYSIQGEGYHTGTAAVFVRFAGCNLRCPFCDTDFHDYTEMEEEEVVAECSRYPSEWVILTGGEPTLQVTAAFVERLHDAGKRVAIETNGTKLVCSNIDWVTCSPKAAYVKNGMPVIKKADEVKVVFDFKTISAEPSWGIQAKHYFIQPCDTGDAEKNEEINRLCVEFVKNNPKWRLSLQTQKILKVR